MAATAGGIRAGRAFVEMGLEGVDKVKAQLASFGTSIQALGSALALGFAVNKVSGWIDSFAGASEELYLTSRQLQMTTTDLQIMRKAARELGIDNETMAAAVNKSRQYVAELATSGQQTNDTMRELGLTLSDVANLSDMDRIELFGERIRKLGNKEMTARIGRQIFGRGGIGLAAAAADFAEQRAEAAGGRLLTPDEVKAGYDLSQAMEKFQRSLKGVGNIVGSTLAPSLTTIYVAITGIVKTATNWVASNKEIIKQIAVAGGIIVGISSALIAVAAGTTLIGVAWGGVMAVISGVVGVVAAIASPVAIIVAAAAAIGYYLLKDAEIFATIRDTVAKLGATASEVFGGIADALSAGDITSAWEIAVLGLRLVWIDFNGWAKETFGLTFIDMFAGIQSAWVETVAFMKSQWLTLNQVGETAGTAIANQIIQAGVALGLVSEDVAKAAIAGNNAAQNDADLARAQQVAQIENDRIAARARIAAAREAGNNALNRGDAQDELDILRRNAEEAASIAAAQRQAGVDGVQRGLEEFAEKGGGARGTFNRDAISGLGGNPLQRLEQRAQEQVDQLRHLNETIERIPARVK